MLKIRLASSADAQLIAVLSRQTFEETFAVYNTRENMDLFMNNVFNEQALVKEVSEKGNIFLLAYDNEEVLGYARIKETSSLPEEDNSAGIEIARIYATKKAIGKGIGKALMHECINIAKIKNKKQIWLGVWERNLKAIRFYENWGFRKQGTHVFVLGNDPQTDWVMKKEL